MHGISSESDERMYIGVHDSAVYNLFRICNPMANLEIPQVHHSATERIL
jgi:hypothetical protein